MSKSSIPTTWHNYAASPVLTRIRSEMVEMNENLKESVAIIDIAVEKRVRKLT